MTHHRGWNVLMLGTVVGLSVAGISLPSHAYDGTDEPAARMDNRALNSGPGSLHSGWGDMDHRERGRNGEDETLLAQVGDIRQEDRREDRRLDRRENRREDRQLDRQENRREDQQLGRREDRREDQQVDRREDHRSNAGGELRGLDRADQVAGEHGREGRENARMMQMDRPNGPERMERPQRPDRPEQMDRPERPDRPERGGRH